MGACASEEAIIILEEGDEGHSFKGEIIGEIQGSKEEKQICFSGLLSLEEDKTIQYMCYGSENIPADAELEEDIKQIKWKVQMVNSSRRFKLEGFVIKDKLNIKKINLDMDCNLSLALTDKSKKTDSRPEIINCKISFKILYDKKSFFTGTKQKRKKKSSANLTSSMQVRRRELSSSKKNTIDFDSGIIELPLTDRNINESRKIYTALTGLHNLGNTCYINSTLQILFHIPYLITEISCKQLRENSKEISYEFIELLKLIEKRSKKSHSPQKFVKLFKSKNSEFNNAEQHDSQEFLRIFLQDFHSEYNENKEKLKEEGNIIKKPSENDSNLSKTELFHKYKVNVENKEKSFISDIFFGYQSYSYKCPCGNYEYSFNQFMDIPLYFENQNESKPINLQQLLYDNFSDEKDIQSMDKCTKCKKKENLYKVTRICNLPIVLILSLQKSNSLNTQKKKITISYPEVLDIEKIIDNDIIKDKRICSKYNLFAINNHSGKIDEGHYYSNIKIEGEWYIFNDDKVVHINDDDKFHENQSETAYVFYYINEKMIN